MDYVFSEEPPIIVVEVEDDEADLPVFHIYLNGVNVGSAYSQGEAMGMASEIFESITGDAQEEGDFL